MITSSLVFIAKVYLISGFGLAIAKTMGFLDIDKSIFEVIIFALESPIKTSAFFNACSKVLTFFFVANSFFSADKFSLSVLITPLLSVIMIFSDCIPKALYILVQEMAAAPAPQTTVLTFSIFLLAISRAFKRAAAEIIAVPCWSSCITGMSSSSDNLFSISKASGAFISSKLIPPKVGDIFLTVSTNVSGSFALISISKTSIPAKILNKSALPSITGLDASGPMSPNPKTAVPFVITATKFPFDVYLYTSFLLSFISKHG